MKTSLQGKHSKFLKNIKKKRVEKKMIRKILKVIKRRAI